MVKINRVTKTRECKDLTKRDLYKMTMNDNIKSFKDIEDGKLIVDIIAVVFYEDEKDSGEISELVSVLTAEGDIYAGNSSIISRKLNEIIELFDVNEDGIFDETFTVLKMSGESKNKRKFATITLV